MINCGFYINPKETKEDFKILKGDGRLVYKEEFFVAPEIQTNIYKGVVPPLYDMTTFNKLEIDIYQNYNNGFRLTDVKKTEKYLILKFEYKDEFIIFKLKHNKNIICQVDCFVEPLPDLFIDNLMNKIENKYFDFRIYREISSANKKRKISLKSFLKSWVNGERSAIYE